MDVNQIKFDDDNLKNYVIQKIVGSGQYCDVFKAIHLETGHVVALKRLKMQQMFNGQTRIKCLREIQMLRQMNHTNIIQHIESFYANNSLYIALEYADAGDLSKMLRFLRENNKYLSEEIIRNFFQQICFGLEYMHSKFIIHRDIKPANILIKRDRVVKLADFGFSRLLEATTQNVRTLVGTPYYMAPERLNGLEYSFPADIWSLGCLLYELITLYPPFYEHNQNIHMLIEKIHKLDYKPINDIYNNELNLIIEWCLLLQPEERLDIKQVQNIVQQKYNPQIIDAIESKNIFNKIIKHIDHEHNIQNGNNYKNETLSSTTIDNDNNQDVNNNEPYSSTMKFKKIYKNIKNIF